jgi:hypothetical protein
MEIYIKSLETGSETLTIEVASVNTINELESLIRIKTGLSHGEQRLIFGGRELHDGNKLIIELQRLCLTFGQIIRC